MTLECSILPLNPGPIYNFLLCGEAVCGIGRHDGVAGVGECGSAGYVFRSYVPGLLPGLRTPRRGWMPLGSTCACESMGRCKTRPRSRAPSGPYRRRPTHCAYRRSAGNRAVLARNVCGVDSVIRQDAPPERGCSGTAISAPWARYAGGLPVSCRRQEHADFRSWRLNGTSGAEE